LQYNYANYSANYMYWGRGSVRFRLINQRADFAFALFTGGLENVRDGLWSLDSIDRLQN
jgi:acid phosphatase type 7